MDRGSPKEFLRDLATVKTYSLLVSTDLLRAALREHSIQLLVRVEEQMRDPGDRLIVQAAIDILREQNP